MVTQNTFHTEHPHISDVTVQNLVAKVFWHRGFLSPLCCTIIRHGTFLLHELEAAFKELYCCSSYFTSCSENSVGYMSRFLIFSLTAFDNSSVFPVMQLLLRTIQS